MAPLAAVDVGGGVAQRAAPEMKETKRAREEMVRNDDEGRRKRKTK